jgi:hypothetical protein
MIVRILRSAAAPEATRLAKLLVDAIGQRLEAEMRDAFYKAEVYLTPQLNKIVQEDCDKFSKIKTLFSDGKLVPLDAI